MKSDYSGESGGLGDSVGESVECFDSNEPKKKLTKANGQGVIPVLSITMNARGSAK